MREAGSIRITDNPVNGEIQTQNPGPEVDKSPDRSKAFTRTQNESAHNERYAADDRYVLYDGHEHPRILPWARPDSIRECTCPVVQLFRRQYPATPSGSTPPRVGVTRPTGSLDSPRSNLTELRNAHAACTLAVFRSTDMSIATNRRPTRAAFAVFFVSLLSAFVTGRASGQSKTDSTALASPHPGLPYAVADFDGDRQPDLATVEGGHAAASVADYSIRFSLSRSGSSSIPVMAPAGGLSVEARDVNGDHALDLIVATMWNRRPVAVFLNDGHGGFSRIETSKFRSAFDSSNRPSASAPSRQPDAAATLAPESSGFCTLNGAISNLHPHLGRIHASTAFVACLEFLASNSGRAPPSGVSSL